VVYVGSYDNNIYAFNANNGATLWTYTTGAPVCSSPSVVNGVVYIGWGCLGSQGSLYAFDQAGGTQAKNKAAVRRPKPATLRPDWSLKVSQPAKASASSGDQE
jgi:outer membrane protein assembly factor BamB